MTTTVTNQAELDAAIAAGESDIVINSPAGVWLNLRAPKATRVTAWDSSTVTAWGSSTVTARGSSTVTARDSSTVTARDSSTVTARGSSTVTARGSSTVHAWDSSTVHAWDSSTVTAWGSSTVTAWDSSTVHAWGSSTVTATAYVAVHLHPGRAKVEGGHIIDVSALDLTDPDIFAAYAGGPLLIADDGRGYRLTFRAGHYEAGCRRFSHAEAVAHWSNPDHPAPESAALLLAAVEAHHGATS